MIQINHVVETELSLDEFEDRFIEWIERNGWTTGGTMREVDKDGEPIKRGKEVK